MTSGFLHPIAQVSFTSTSQYPANGCCAWLLTYIWISFFLSLFQKDKIHIPIKGAWQRKDVGMHSLKQVLSSLPENKNAWLINETDSNSWNLTVRLLIAVTCPLLAPPILKCVTGMLYTLIALSWKFIIKWDVKLGFFIWNEGCYKFWKVLRNLHTRARKKGQKSQQAKSTSSYFFAMQINNVHLSKYILLHVSMYCVQIILLQYLITILD